MNRIRVYHATLAILSLLAYLTGEFGLIHAWLGYGVAVVIVFRLFWALIGERSVGFARFYPSFKGLIFNNALTHPAISKSLILGIAVSLILATGTGLLLDKGASIGIANAGIVTSAYADDGKHGKNQSLAAEALEETHKFFANLMLLLVGMHAAYLLIFRFPMAKFMLFMDRPPEEKK